MYIIIVIPNISTCMFADIFLFIRSVNFSVIMVFGSSAPLCAPEIFEAVAEWRQVVFSWSPPPVTCNGSITCSYTFSCSPSPSSLPPVPLPVKSRPWECSFHIGVYMYNVHLIHLIRDEGGTLYRAYSSAKMLSVLCPRGTT